MRNMIIILALLALPAWATNYVTTVAYTFDVMYPEPSVQSIGGEAGRPIRATISVVNALGAAYDLSDLDVSPYMIQPADGVINDEPTLEGVILDATAGVYRVSWTPARSGYHQLVVNAIDADLEIVSLVGRHDVAIADQAGVEVTASVTVTQPSNTVSLSLVPLTPSNGVIGTASIPWGEVNAVTGRYDKLIVSGDLDVAGAITAVDTSKVALAGDTMQGPITNNYGYWGEGGGLTNLVVQITTNGTGNVITNVTQSSGGIRIDMGAVSGGSSAFTVTTNNGLRYDVASGFLTNNVEDDEESSVIIGGENKSITTAGGRNNVLIGGSQSSISSAGAAEGNVIIGGKGSGSRDITSAGDGNTIIGGAHGGDISGGIGGTIIGGGTGAGQHPLISATGQGNTIIGGNQSGRSEITGSVNGGTIIGGLGLSSISAGNASSAIGGYNIDLAGSSGYNGAFGGHTVAHNSSAYFAHSIGGIYITLNAPFAHSIGGWRVANTGSNSITIVGKDWTNSTPNVVGMGVPVLYNGWGNIPTAGPAGTVIEAWVNYGSSNVKYAVSTVGTSIIQVIE